MSTNGLLYFIGWCNQFIPKLLVITIMATAALFTMRFILVRSQLVKNGTTKKLMTIICLSPGIVFILVMLFIIFLPGILSLMST